MSNIFSHKPKTLLLFFEVLSSRLSEKGYICRCATISSEKLFARPCVNLYEAVNLESFRWLRAFLSLAKVWAKSTRSGVMDKARDFSATNPTTIAWKIYFKLSQTLFSVHNVLYPALFLLVIMYKLICVVNTA